MPAKCKSYGAPIEWIKTPAGKNHPIDAESERRWIYRKGMWLFRPTYTSHFATCPNADQHRKGNHNARPDKRRKV